MTRDEFIDRLDHLALDDQQRSTVDRVYAAASLVIARVGAILDGVEFDFHAQLELHDLKNFLEPWARK
jgi:hypothetical protein